MESRATVTAFVQSLVQHLGVSCEVDVREEPRGEGVFLAVSLSAPDGARTLIGRNGQTLSALENIIRAACARRCSEVVGVSVDANDYRRLKAQQVAEVARQAVARVRDTQKAEALPPMSSYERRIVHMELAAHSDIATESIGEEPHRRVVIKPFSLDA